MEVEDLIGIAAHNLWIHVPQPARDRFFIILVRELLRTNRMVQEQAGVGKASRLTSPELTEEIEHLMAEGFWKAYDRPEEEKKGIDRNT